MLEQLPEPLLEPLPETLKPQSLFDTGGQVEGFTPLAKLKRLTAQLVNDEGRIETRLFFDKDAQGLRLVHGSIKTELPLICQRCLKTMHHPVDIELSLAIVINTEQAESLSESYEPLLFESTTLSLMTLIEDELMLALPLVAKHTDENCNGGVALGGDDGPYAAEAELEPEKPHPFAGLAQIKGTLGRS